jgi:hypothetical protein
MGTDRSIDTPYAIKYHNMLEVLCYNLFLAEKVHFLCRHIAIIAHNKV